MLLAVPISLAVAQNRGRTAKALGGATTDAITAERQRAARQLAETRRSPAKRAERDRSRSEFRGMSAQEALRTVRGELPDVMRRHPARALRLPAGDRVKGYVNSQTALVDGAGKRPDGLVSSPTPMLAKDRDGKASPVDLTLERSGDALVPRNPQARVRISSRLDRGVRFSRSGWGLELTQRPVRSELVANKAFGANAIGADTDVIVEPVPGGVEVSHVLRSQRSPESLPIKIDVPERGSLEFEDVRGVPANARRQHGRPVLVLDAKGRTLGRILPPSAVDAQGTPVAIAMRIEGTSVVMDVAHATKDVAYPLTVDPFVQEDFRFWLIPPENPNQQPKDFFGWEYEQLNSWVRTATPGVGLTIATRTSWPYAAGNFARWVWKSPPSRNGFPQDGTFITKADFGPYYHTTAPNMLSCVVMGIFAGDNADSGSVWRRSQPSDPLTAGPYVSCTAEAFEYRVTCTHFQFCGLGDTSPTGTVGNRALFQLAAVGNSSASAGALLGGSLLFYRENAPPRVTPTFPKANPQGTGWIDDLPGTMAATDGGVGLNRVRIAGGPSGNTWTPVDLADEDLCPVLGPGTPFDERGKRGSCPASRSANFTTGAAPEGAYSLSTTATDIVGNTAPAQSATVRVDHSRPGLTVSGSLWDNRANDYGDGPYTVSVAATDPLAGVKSVELLVDGVRQKPVDHYAEQTCANGGCAMNRTFSVDSLPDGTHTIKVITVDQTQLPAGSPDDIVDRHRRVREWTVNMDRSAPPVVDRRKLGLEDYYHYDSINTGAGSAAHTNLATGNVVWHKVPVVNPGQGLSSVMNLTYNSHDTGGLLADLIGSLPPTGLDTSELAGTSYGEVGRGFSMGISGLTRLNEPLIGVNGLLPLASGLGNISFTDPDGTHHTFKKQGNTYAHPPGVNLWLRRFTPAGLPGIDQPKAWAITRPDGVTFYFDEYGYPRSIEDRNTNKITFQYEFYNPTLPLDILPACLPNLLGLVILDGILCAKRVKSVVDQNGRAMDIVYRPRQLLSGLPGGLPNVSLPIGNRAGKIDRIIDHRAAGLGARRVTRFTYDDAGYLTQLTEALAQSGTAAPTATAETRTTTFEYTDAGPLVNKQMTRVIDPKGQGTSLAYFAPNDPLPLVPGSGKPVKTITDRRNHATNYAFVPAAPGTQTTVTDALNRATQYKLDGRGRLTEMTDPRPATLKLEWDGNNNLEKMVEAAGTPDEATTSMSYNTNGLLTERVDPESTPAREKVMRLTYRTGAGTQLGAGNVDAGRGFVSDLESITRPEGNKTTITLDPRGNATARTDGEGKTALTTFDTFGRVIDETDEVGNVTRYQSFDANGLPQVVIDPRGNATATPANDGRWVMRYDAVGNAISVTDPRGAQDDLPPDAPRTAFTTTREYDVLDRLRVETAPKDSSAGDFIARRWEFDNNDNVIAETDGELQVTTTEFTPMDAPEVVTSPPVAHATGTAAEVTRNVYDAVDNLVREIAPEGTRTPAAGDHEIEFRYDRVDQKVAEIRHAASGPQSTLATSWAHDLRGNVIGETDPRTNAEHAATEPEANAKLSDRRRYTYTYDLADNRRFQAADPAGENDRTEWQYDLNDRLVAQIDPRGHEAGNNPNDFRTDYRYDRRDLLVGELSPATLHEGDSSPRRRELVYGRRADGKVQTRTAPKGTRSGADGDFITTFDYDPMGDVANVSLPRAERQYGPELQIQWQRNAVGDPTRIVDARGNQIVNTFYDSGELRSTDRPSWWEIEEDEDAPAEKSLEEIAAGSSSTEDGELPDSEAQGDFGAVEPEELPEWLPRAGATVLGYDREMRLTSVRDAGSKTTTIVRDALGRVTQTRQPFGQGTEDLILNDIAYDHNGNVVEQTDGERFTTTLEYDEFDREIEERAPGRQSGEVQLTTTSYDHNSNVTAVQTPRGATFTERRTYDALDRLVTDANAAGDTTTFEYDAAGNEVSERRPNGNTSGLTAEQRARFTTTRTFNALNEVARETDGLGNATTYAYDHNGNVALRDEPGAAPAAGAAVQRRITQLTHDGRDLPWAETTGSGANRRTTVSEFDGNGNLRRSVEPAGVGADGLPANADSGAQVTTSSSVTREAKVREYSRDNLLVAVHLPWGERDTQDRRRFRQDYVRSDRGWIQAIDSPYEWTQSCGSSGGPGCTSRTTYLHYDTGWVRSSSDPQQVDPDSGAVTYEQDHEYTYDRRGNQRTWSSDVGRVMRRSFNPNGTLASRSADPASGPSRRYEYAYNLNESLVEMVDDDLDRRTVISYDEAERPLRVNEVWSRGRDTTYGYDRDGNVLERTSDIPTGGASGSAKTTAFAYDELDREQSMTVSASGQPSRSWESTYWPSGEMRTRVKRRVGVAGNGVTESWFYSDNSDLVGLRRQRTGQAGFDKDQVYSYDANGNRTRDERGEHVYNARGQLRTWKRPAGYASGQGAGNVDYELNGSGAIERKIDTGRATTSTYRGDRLLRSTTAASGLEPSSTSTFSYDGFGSLTRVDTQIASAPTQPKPTTYNYDAFQRLISARGPQQDADTTYRYDGLDRRDTRLDGPKTYEYSYVGLTEKLSREEGPEGSKGYDYDSDGQRLAQTVTTGGSTDLRFYGLDALGSVESLETGSSAPTAAERYRYDPYGELVNADALGARAKDNPFRFQGHYYDEQIKTYDMRARHYRPDIARFLTQDRYEEAGADVALQSNPQTNNRYAFGAGNPVSNVEIDGHCYVFCGLVVQGLRQGATLLGRALLPRRAGAEVARRKSAEALRKRAIQTAARSKAIADRAARRRAIAQAAARRRATKIRKAAKQRARAVRAKATQQRQRARAAGKQRTREARNRAQPRQSSTPRTSTPNTSGQAAGRGPQLGTQAPRTRSTSLAKNDARYPANDGFLGGYSRTETLTRGTRVDRFGREGGDFVSPQGTPLHMRALPPWSPRTDLYSVYEVLKPLTVRGGLATNYYGRGGLGVQYLLPRPVNVLVRKGFLGRLGP